MGSTVPSVRGVDGISVAVMQEMTGYDIDVKCVKDGLQIE
jgi:hypothetical protein